MAKRAVISGASSGVGLETARALIGKGWEVVGLARSRAKLEAAQKELGKGFRFFELDVSRAEQVRSVFDQIGQLGRIDLLVNNAAVFKMKSFAECTTDDINSMVDTNLKGTLFCTHSALKWMNTEGSRIVNVSSVAGTHGLRNQAIYCASKFGVNGFGEALSQELLAGTDIRLTTICPGGIDTPLWDAPTNPYPGNRQQILKVEDVVRAIEYVAELPTHVVMKSMVMFPSNEWH